MKRSCRQTPSTRILVVAAVSLVAAGFGAPLARADDGSDPVVEAQAVVDAALTTAATVPVPSVPAEPEQSADAPTAAAPVPVPLPAVEPPPSGQSPEPETPPARTTQDTEAPVDTAATAPEAAPAPAPEPDAPSVSTDQPSAQPAVGPEAAAAGDITEAQPISPPAPAPAPVVATQQSPVNVSISIRIESPGDNGDVTQVNAVGIDATDNGAPAAEPAEAQPSGAADIGGDTGSDPNSETDPRSNQACEPTTGCCAVVIVDSMCLKTDVSGFSFDEISALINMIFGNAFANSNSSAQLPRGAAQIGPVNVNISIRIQSPGNNGAVTQTNLVQVKTAITVAAPVIVVTPPLDPVAIVAQALTETGGELSAGSAAAVDQGTAAPTPTATPPVAGAPQLPTVRVAITIAPISPGSIVISPSLRIQPPPLQAWTPPVRTAVKDDSASTEERGEKDARQAKRPPAPAPAPPVLPPLAASFAPAPSTGGVGGGGLPLALTIPFAVGLLDVGFRRLRASRHAPSAVGGRRPERPG